MWPLLSLYQTAFILTHKLFFPILFPPCLSCWEGEWYSSFMGTWCLAKVNPPHHIAWWNSLWVRSVAGHPAAPPLWLLRVTHSCGRQCTRWSTWAQAACANTSQCVVTWLPRDSKAPSHCSTSAARLQELTPALIMAQPMHRNREMIL